VDDFPNSILLMLLFVGSLVLIHLAWYELLFTGIAIVVLGISLSRFFFPTRYFLDSKEARIRHLFAERRYPLTRFKNYYAHKSGVYLSSFEKPGFLDPFRGVFLRFHGNRDEVLRFLQANLHAASPSR
jgi:hypothetical protein